MAPRTTLLIGFLVTIVTGAALAQNSPKAAAEESGMTAYLQLLGTTNSEGTFYELNSNVGYDFNSHFGLTVGVPVYFIRPAASTGTSSATGLGDPYLAVHVRYPNPKLNFATLLIGAVPVGNSKEGLSTGRATFDWTGHIDHSIARLTPFVEFGISNTTTDSTLYLRPYTTLGFNTHFRGGAYYDLWRFVTVGAAGFDILPTGQQTVFSRVTHGQAAGGTGRHGPPFLNSQQTTGTASIAHDDGFSTWVEVFRQHPVDFQVGFTRSFVYDLSSVSFGIGFDLGQLYRRSQK
jgi:hypothetical protein